MRVPLVIIGALFAASCGPTSDMSPGGQPQGASASGAALSASPTPSPTTPASEPAASPSPTPTPDQWLTAQFLRVDNANADTTAFDTRSKDPEAPSSGGIFSLWRDKGVYGHSFPKAFVVEASWRSGGAPPWRNDRSFEMHFIAPPQAGQRFNLSTGAVSATNARLYYLQGYRFFYNVWAATDGTLEVDQAQRETVTITIKGAKMAPAPNGEDYRQAWFETSGSEWARGTFEVNANGVVLPRNAYDRSEPYKEPTPSPQ